MTEEQRSGTLKMQMASLVQLQIVLLTQADHITALTETLFALDANARKVFDQQLAIAAATTGPDQQASALLRNEFAAMQQMSDQFVATHTAATYISPDSLDNNAQDQKITGCEQALVAMASTKQFQDAGVCH